MRSKTPESDLHFVRDADRACSAHVAVNLRQIIRWKNDLAADAGQRFCDIRCNARSVIARAVENLRNVTRDRKSTRLNSSHRCISYAVFCLKKKKKRRTTPRQAQS